MLVKKHRIRNVEKYLPIKSGDKFYLGITNLEEHKKEIDLIGFIENLAIGHCILPRQNLDRFADLMQKVNNYP